MKTISEILTTNIDENNRALFCPMRHTFRIIVGVFVCWCLCFIWRSSFIIDGNHWFCLADDAMVSMRYAKNLALGLGPVWNTNDYIEGFTNPLWMLFMSIPHLVRIPENLTSLVIQIASMLILVTNIFAARRLGRAMAFNNKEEAGIVAALFTACLYSLNYWALMGMEVGCLAALTTWAVTLAVENFNSHRFSPAPFLLCAAATFVRLDAVAILFALGLSAFLIDRNHRKSIALICILSATIAIGVQEFVRYAVYGTWLPNTYYLKMVGFPAGLRISRGVLYTGLSLLCYPCLFILIYALATKFCNITNLRNHKTLLYPVTVIAAMVAYSAYVGGDAWERVIDLNRFVSIVSPLLVTILAVIIFRRNCPRIPILCILTIGCVIFRSTSPADTLLLRPPVDRKDNIRNTQIALSLRNQIPPTHKVAVEYAGAMPYFMPEHRMIDLLGKSDRNVAHTPMHRGLLKLSKWREFYPGHLKWDYQYSIGNLKPEVICAIWKKNAEYAEPFLTQYLEKDYLGAQLYFLKGTNIPELH